MYLRKIKCFSLSDNKEVLYSVPTTDQAHTRMNETFGHVFDKIEGRDIYGGVPELWQRHVV